MIQERLFRLAVEAVVVTAHADTLGRWSVVVRCRRQGDEWESASKDSFELLATPELVDVIEAALAHELGL